MAFSFGSTTAAPASTTASTGFSLGGPPAKTPATGFSFGATTTTAQPAAPNSGFGFGSSAATTTTAPAFGGFGATTTTTTAAPTLGGFGTPTASTTSASSLGGFGGFGTASTASSTTAATGFGGFGATTTSTAPPAFGAPTTNTQSSFGFGSTTSTAPSSQPTVTGLGGNTVAPSFGLGGTSVPGSQPEGNKESKGDGPSGKESMIPQELFATVEDLKKMIKDEKAVSSEVSHTSDKQFKKVSEETEALTQLVSGLATGVQNNRAKLEQLKMQSGQELVNVEIAVRTRDTPPNMQYENVAPMEYFRRLVAQFEQSMVEYRQGILAAERHLQSLSVGNPITSGDIVAAVQKLHQALTDLAAKYQVVHTALTQQKCEYLSMQRQLSSSNANAHLASKVKTNSGFPASLSGPSPFNPPADALTQARQAQLHRTQAPGHTQGGQGPPTQGLGQKPGTWGPQPTQGFGLGSSTFGSNTTGFGTSTFGANTTGFGANTAGFGSNTAGFGANTSGFGANTTGFGANNSTFGTSGFGAQSTNVTPGTKRGKH